MRETGKADVAFLERGKLSPGEEDTPGFGVLGPACWRAMHQVAERHSPG